MKYHFRADVRHRLVKLLFELAYQLQRDEDGFDSPYFGDLLPRIRAVFALLWCKRVSDLFCKKTSYSKAGYVDLPCRVVSKEFLDIARPLVVKDTAKKCGFTDNLPF